MTDNTGANGDVVVEMKGVHAGYLPGINILNGANLIARKGELIGKAMGIIGGLRDAVDTEKGGEIAANLDNLYAFMQQRLSQANLKNDPAMLEEVAKLLREIKEGWDGIRQS